MFYDACFAPSKPDTDWEQVELTFAAAPNAVSIGIYGSISQTANDYAWIDDLELHEIQD
jgi:hypothetical protein